MKKIMQRTQQDFLEKFPEASKLFLSNNKVGLIGKMEDDFHFSHERYGKLFFNSRIIIPKNEDDQYYIPIIVPEEMLASNLYRGKIVKAIGTFRSRNEWKDGKSHLKLSVMAEYLSYYNADRPENFIYLKGYLCKKPFHRMTPKGKSITDLLIAVNRTYGKSSYIPCIAWGGYSVYASQLKIGDEIEFWGKIQSRDYKKQGEIRTTYEVSIVKWF